TFLAKSDVRGWPVFGWFARQAGTRFIRREAKQDLVRVSRELDSVIAEGLNLVVFLEGTSSDGRDVLRFRSSLLAPAIASAWTLVPAAMAYHVSPPYSVEHDIAWWGDMTLWPHLWRLCGIPETRATVRLGRPRVASGNRKVLAESLRQDVADLRGQRAAVV
ncbi:MAG TPA: lysophospholipid acyltransferase family protein, partial [Candidatus Synoicihabitans sp.]|nr:lysophospholipid acyltransferase family protein [Candidatus Synoicihabitans sp.]